MDHRFFSSIEPLALSDLAHMAGVEFDQCPQFVVGGLSILANAQPDQMSYCSDRSYAGMLYASKAGCVFVTEELKGALSESAIGVVVKNPKATWSRLASCFYRSKKLDPLEKSSDGLFEEGVEIGHGAIVSKDVEIGRGTIIGPYAIIGAGVRIGRNCHIGSHVTIECAYIGNHVRIQPGTRIGESGFGVTGDAKGLVDIPQLGRVLIQDHVSIGANSCIDRGAYDDTIIGEGSRFDNLVHIAHNVIIGRNVVLAAFVGIAGSSTVGDGAMFGGQSSVSDHIRIGKGAKIGGASAVTRDVADFQTVAGVPSRPVKQYLREVAWLSKQIRAKNAQEK